MVPALTLRGIACCSDNYRSKHFMVPFS